MQQIQLALFVEIASQNEPSGLAKLLDPCRVSRPELPFQLLTQFLGQRWTLPIGGNRYLQVAALHHCWIKEIAILRNIDHVAEYVAALCFVINEFVRAIGSRGYNGKKLAVEFAICKGAQFQFDLPCFRPFVDLGAGLYRNHADVGARIDETANLGRADLS